MKKGKKKTSNYDGNYFVMQEYKKIYLSTAQGQFC